MQEIFRMDLGNVNCYLGKENDNFILFDTGGHILLDKQWDNRYDILLNQLKMHGCTSENLKLIVLTHGDNDHVANASALRKYFNAKIAIHEDDRALVENPNVNMVMKSFHYRSILFKLVFLFMKKAITKIMVKTLDDYERFIPDIYLADGDSIDEYGFHAKVLHLPGHTLGSIAILTQNNELIAGDLFSNNKKPEMAPNAYNFTLLKTSIEKIKSIGVKTIFPGHGNPFHINELR